MTYVRPASKPTGGCRLPSKPGRAQRLLNPSPLPRNLSYWPGRGPGQGRCRGTTDGGKGSPCTHFVALRVGQDGVLSRQGDAAGCDHQENAHLEVPQVHDVMAGPADPRGWTSPLSWQPPPPPASLTPTPRTPASSRQPGPGPRRPWGEQFNSSGTTLV